MRPSTTRSLEVSSPGWRKSSFSWANGDCVEVAGSRDGIIRVRDSTNPGGRTLAFGRAQWNTFVGDVRDAQLRG